MIGLTGWLIDYNSMSYKPSSVPHMNLLHVITGIHNAAGTSTFCGEICNQLAGLGHDVTIAVVNPTASNQYPLNPNVHLISIRSLLGDKVEGRRTADRGQRADVVHLHGLWLPILHRVSNWAHARSIPVVWSTHGMTAPWAMRHKWWKKWLPWHLYQKRDLMRASLIHCTSDFEIEWNKARGFERIFLAPLGTFLPKAGKVLDDSADSGVLGGDDCFGKSKTLLFVGRIHPVKALDRLIEAFARATSKSSKPSESTKLNPFSSSSPWTLRMVGPDQVGHRVELMSLCDRLGLVYSSSPQSSTSIPTRPQVEFVGPKFGSDLDAEYAACTALALVSHTENFGATVIDALAHGKPVITSTKTPWRVVRGLCGWWVDNDVESLAAGISELLNASPSELHALGANGRRLVEERFTWSAVTRKIEAAYGERFEV